MADLLGFLWSGESDNHFSLKDPTVGSLEFDCIDAETHDWKRNITMNPVENGSSIADHIIEQPDGITLTGMISNAPIKGYIGQMSGVIEGTINNDLVAKAFALLDELRKSKQPVTIYTRYRTYETMLIQSINIPRTPDIGDAIVFTIQAVQVRLVTSQTTTLPKGLGVKKTTSATGRSGRSNSNDPATQKRVATEGNNGKVSQSISTLQGIKNVGSKAKESLVSLITGAR